MTYFRHREEQPHEPLFTAPIPEDEEELYPEEAPDADVRGRRWRLAAGVGDLLGILVCMALIMGLLALLFSLVNFVLADLPRSFPILRSIW